MEKKELKQWVRGPCIGKGSFGSVSLATSTSNGQIFAVKTVDSKYTVPFAIQSLENEIQILKSVTSPYIVQYLGDDWTQGSQRNLHVEYVAGGTLADLAAESELDEHVIRRYTQCILEALCHIHSIGIVHCDIKGRNVLVDPAGTGKLADFGAARRISGEESGGPCGTPLWMAPEVARREAQSSASDVWSLGCTVIEMATGKPPWTVKDNSAAAATMFWIGFGDQVPKFPGRLSEQGKDFLEKCLKRRASERWTCEQLLSHPFVADFRITNPSPRSVLDEINFSFQENEDESDNEQVGVDSDCEKMVSSARERIGRLATEDREIDWDSDGWEVVRGEATTTTTTTTTTTREGIELEYSESNFGGERGCEGNVFSGVMRLSCCCWRLFGDGLGCQHGPKKWFVPVGASGGCFLFRCKLYFAVVLIPFENEMQTSLLSLPLLLLHFTGYIVCRYRLVQLQV